MKTLIMRLEIEEDHGPSIREELARGVSREEIMRSIEPSDEESSDDLFASELRILDDLSSLIVPTVQAVLSSAGDVDKIEIRCGFRAFGETELISRALVYKDGRVEYPDERPGA